MDKEEIRTLLKNVKSGKTEIEEALRFLRSLPYQDLGDAKIDTHRDLRRGFPEVILCGGKSIEQIERIVRGLSPTAKFIMATKADSAVFRAIRKIRKDAVYYEKARIVLVGKKRMKKSDKTILVVSAGTSDVPIAEEAAVTAEIMGNVVDRAYDIGVAGVHRLFDSKEKLFSANVIIVVAGMEGALASIVGGLVDSPVISVPTSVGYGASFEGLAALLSMLNCCSPGSVTVNIDNGFGAGYFASLINRMGEEE
ncbi:MAG TPA: nickel pincer cofactor biosynthesis protein LarB [Syntrophales bacterium]|nr:nickel pincer cofactor biosynthesis protein LarB [Syntrophales bacterium]